MAVFCGPNVTAVVLARGEGGVDLAVFGCNEHAKLGCYGGQRVLRRPEPLPLPFTEGGAGPERGEAQAAKVAFGQEHVAVVTRCGRLFTGGVSSDGQTGHETFRADRAPLLLVRVAPASA